jgi:hypothetical protein
VINLTLGDDQENDSNDDNVTEVSQLRITRTAQYGVRLIQPSLIDRFQIVDQLPSAPTALFAEVTRLLRPHEITNSSHTLAGRATLGRVSLCGRHYTASWPTASGRPICSHLQPPSIGVSLRHDFSRRDRSCLWPTASGRPCHALVRPPTTAVSTPRYLSWPGQPYPSPTASELLSYALPRPPSIAVSIRRPYLSPTASEGPSRPPLQPPSIAVSARQHLSLSGRPYPSLAASVPPSRALMWPPSTAVFLHNSLSRPDRTRERRCRRSRSILSLFTLSHSRWNGKQLASASASYDKMARLWTQPQERRCERSRSTLQFEHYLFLVTANTSIRVRYN